MVRDNTFFSAFKNALPFHETFEKFVFHLGYQGWQVPRLVRKIFARSGLHRAWLSGFTGLGVLSIDELRPDSIVATGPDANRSMPQ